MNTDEQIEPQIQLDSKFKFQQWEKVGAVVAVLLVLGYVAAAQYLNFWPFQISIAPVNTPTPAPAQIQDPFAGWQTYRNEEYGFEFRYPKEFSVREESFDVLGISIEKDGHYLVSIYYSPDFEFANRETGNCKINQLCETRPSNLEELANYYLNGVKPIKFAGAQGFEGFDKNRPIGSLLLEHDGHFYQFLYELTTKNLSSQILSTFKFIETASEKDVKKIADINQFWVMAELYYDKYKKYPKVEGNTPEARWQSFSTTVVNEGLYPKELPRGYDYQTSSNRQSAVFKATLEAPDNEDVKRANVDGIVFGLDCNKPNYCKLIGDKIN